MPRSRSLIFRFSRVKPCATQANASSPASTVLNSSPPGFAVAAATGQLSHTVTNFTGARDRSFIPEISPRHGQLA
ncbi:MAG: hypothetical protein KGK11_13800, partial [Sphingomonadales bacterium]|nr:hypothetical protein [Sphingomonadales bacterium]